MRRKQILAAILMIVMLCSNTMSVFATSADAVTILGNNIGEEVQEISEEEVDTSLDGEAQDIVALDESETNNTENVGDIQVTETVEATEMGEPVEEAESTEAVAENLLQSMSNSQREASAVALDNSGQFSKVQISQYEYEKLTLSWEFTCSENDDLSEEGFVIKYFKPELGTYEEWPEESLSMSRDPNTDGAWYANVSNIPIDETTGNFKTLYFQIVPQYHSLDENGKRKVKNGEYVYEYGTPSSSVTNDGLLNGCFQNSENDDFKKYVEFCLIDDENNPIEKISIHVGESVKFGMGLRTSDDDIVELRTEDAIKALSGDVDSIYVFSDISRKVWSYSLNKELDTNSMPVEFPYTMETIESFDTYITGTEVNTAGDIFLQVTANFGFCDFYVRVPITIEEAEEGETYFKAHELVLSDDKEVIYQQIRDIMVARAIGKDAYICVPQSLLSTDSTDVLDLEDVLDFYEERPDMKPEEGDYLNYTIGDGDEVSSDSMDYELIKPFYGPDGTSYYLIEITVPFITTAAQEAEVNKKIDELVHTEGGALYKGKYSTDREKVEAIYNYIRANVSGTVPGSRTTPIYHTAYHALIKESGTCQAFALLFTRLSREMGIPSKVIMGTDASAHTYNIVQLGDEWYFIDASAGKGISTALEFERAEEQPQYLNKRFVQSYMIKVAGYDYYADAERVIEVKETNGGEETTTVFVDSDAAKEHIIERACMEANEDAVYTYTLKSGTLTDADLNFACRSEDNTVSVEDRVTIDFNGNTVTVSDGNETYICAGVVKNGTITIGDGAILGLIPLSYINQDSYYQDIDIVYKSTHNKTDQSPELVIGSSTVNMNEDTKDNKVILEPSVSIEKMKKITLEGNVTVNTDIASKYMTLGNYNTEAMFDITVNGAVTVDSIADICSNLKVEKITSKNSTIMNPLSKISVFDEANFSGTTQLDYEAFNYDWDNIYWAGMSEEDKEEYYKGVEIELIRQYASQNNSSYSKMGTLNLNGKLDNRRIIEAEGISDTIPMFELAARNCIEGECNTGTSTFTPGDVIGTVTAGKGVNSKSGDYNIAVTEANLADYLAINVEDKDGVCLEYENNIIMVACPCVEVTDPSGKYATQATSLKKAVDKLGSLAGKTAGSYTFNFIENSTLTSDISLPSYVTEAVFALEDDVTFSFNGKKITTAGKLTLDDEDVWNNANVNVGTLTVADGTLALETVTAKDVDIAPGACLIVDNLTQTSQGSLYAWEDATLVVNESATIYNPVLNVKAESGNGEAGSSLMQAFYIYKPEATKINILGKLTRANEATQLAIGSMTEAVSAENANLSDIVLQDYTEQTALFDTKISGFPLDAVCVKQAGAENASEYNVIYKVGNTIYVGKKVLLAGGKDAKGNEIEEKEFVLWSDAIAYLNIYAHANAEFEIGVTENLNTNENLTMPKKAASIWIYGGEKQLDGVSVLSGEETEAVSLTYLGDISLAADTTIENIDLHAKKYNSKTATYDDYASALKLNGKVLTLNNTSADLTSIAGNAKAVLALNDAEIAVTKAVSSLGYLYMTGSSLAADNVTATNTLLMDSSTIDCVTKITLNNVISESEDNVLSYGGNTSKNNLTIKGNVTFTEDADKTVALSRKDNEQVIIRKNAITLEMKSMEPSSYVEGAVLCDAQKAGSSWFVVGSTWNEADERTAVTYGTYKKNKNILCGELDENVNLYSSQTGADGTYVLEGGFITLQDALSEIDKLAVTGNYYQVELMKSDKDVVTFTNKAITFPSKTAGITIMADSSMAESLPDPKIYFKGNLTLKSNTVFEEIVFAPVKNASISLGNFSLKLSECVVDADDATAGFSQITGSGVKKTSALILDDTALTLLGNVNNVGKLIFISEQDEEAKLISYGTVNVGDVELGTDAVLGGLAAVTRKKVSDINTVTKTASKITINGDVISDNGSTLYLDLYEKVGQTYQQLDFDAPDMDTIEASGIQMAKGLLVTYPNVKALQRENSTSLIKSAGYLLWYPSAHGTGQSEHGAELKFSVGNKEVVIPCLTFGDAVTEINNQKVKRDYTITLTKAGNEISGAVQNGSSFVPKALKMPTAKYIDSLVLEGKETSGIKLGYLSNITFTCDTTLRDIDFVQMVKVKNEYLTMDEAKANYPAAVTVNTGGFALNIEGMVTFNTPVTLNGKNTGTLTLNEEGTIATLTNQNDVITDGENVIYGSVTAFKNLEVSHCNLTLKEYKVSATSNSYKASANKVTNLKLTDGNITVIDEGAKSSFTVTGDADINAGKLIVNGKVVLKNVTIIGEDTPTIKADTDFTISGTLSSRSDTTTLITRRKGANKAPYLNIKGEVIHDGYAPVYVGVYNHVGSVDEDKPVTLANAPQVTAQLLSATKAPADAFRPIDTNTSGHGPYSEFNPQGYWLSKVKSNIYVYEGK